MKKIKKPTTKDLKKFLEKYYKFSHDVVSDEICYEINNGKGIKKRFERAYFFDTLSTRFEGASGGQIREVIRNIRFRPFNRLKGYLDSQISHPNTNPFDKLDDYFELEDTPPFSFGSVLENHMVRAVRTILNGTPNRFIFALISSREYLGKTQFIEWLFPEEVKQYCMSTLSGRKEKSDTILARKFLVNIDEFSGAKKSSDEHLKAMISQNSASVWVAFTNQIERKPRLTSFFATRNYKNKPILNAESSNSRYLIYNIKSIDWSYKDYIDVKELWRWAIAKARDPKYDANPSIEEIRKIESYNKRFTKRKRNKPAKKEGFQSAALYTLLGGILAAAARVFVPLLIRVMS